MKAVVLLSGGVDSTVCALLAAKAYGAGDVGGLNILYGQKHAREADAAEAVVSRLGMAGLETLELPGDLFAHSGSSLIDAEEDIPAGPYPAKEGPVSTFVPFRNGIMISAAASYALKVGAEAVYFGAHAEDALLWAYPDCTPEFLGAMKNAVWAGTYRKVRLVTPLEWLTKAEVVELGNKHGAPFELTWSCYRGGREACGECATCLSRRAAFEANGLEDPAMASKGGER
jgi:7-cyano-7-deazaguanine synthase